MRSTENFLLFTVLFLNFQKGFADDSFAKCELQPNIPKRLSETCFSNLTQSLSFKKFQNFFEYEPQFPAYSDGAAKRRWIYFPAQTQINTQDLDNWIFPKGTIVFKEFSIGDKKIETRILEKTKDDAGFSSWRSSNYAWILDQQDAVLINDSFYSQTPEELGKYSAAQIQNQFKVAPPKTCIRCHSGVADAVNGFSYLQLSTDSKMYDVLRASDSGLLSHPPKVFDSIKGSDLDKKAIGYIQTNCAICHSGRTRCPGNFAHSQNSTNLENETFMVTANENGLIEKGNPEKSYLFEMFSSGEMPKITPVKQDSEGVDLIRKWISQLK